MSTVSKTKVLTTGIWVEFARRKLLFHKNEKWQDIRQWGLMKWGEVRPYMDRGLLLTGMHKDNHTIWVQPSQEAYTRYIEPLLQMFDLEELTFLAGFSSHRPDNLDAKLAKHGYRLRKNNRV